MAPVSPSVLFIADVFHPVGHLAILSLLNGNVSHGGGASSAMPVFLARREPDHITGVDLLDWSAFALSPATPGGHNQSLAKWMRVPRGARARLKRYARALNQRRIGCLKQWVDPYYAGKPVRRTSS